MLEEGVGGAARRHGRRARLGDVAPRSLALELPPLAVRPEAVLARPARARALLRRPPPPLGLDYLDRRRARRRRRSGRRRRRRGRRRRLGELDAILVLCAFRPGGVRAVVVRVAPRRLPHELPATAEASEAWFFRARHAEEWRVGLRCECYEGGRWGVDATGTQPKRRLLAGRCAARSIYLPAGRGPTRGQSRRTPPPAPTLPGRGSLPPASRPAGGGEGGRDGREGRCW